MAAVDPTQEPEADADGNVPNVPRSTLRLVKRAFPDLDDEDDDEIDEEYMKALIGDSDEDDEDDDVEANGGPSDPVKAKKHKQEAALKKLLEAAAAEEEEESDEDMEDAKPNGAKKGKGKALKDDDEDDEDEDSDDEDDEGDLENFVICTLDTERVSLLPFLLLWLLFSHGLLTTVNRTTNSLLTSLSTTAKRSFSSFPVPTPSI